MEIVYSRQAKEQLYSIKEYISQNNKRIAIEYLLKIKYKIEILSNYPYIGKINATFSNAKIRDFVVYVYKVIYKIDEERIIILAIYRYTNLDEKNLKVD